MQVDRDKRLLLMKRRLLLLVVVTMTMTVFPHISVNTLPPKYAPKQEEEDAN